jgi:hypothetical protein
MHRRSFLGVFAFQVFVGGGEDAVMAFDFDEQTVLDAKSWVRSSI